MPTDPLFLQEFSCFSGLSKKHLKDIAKITTAVGYSHGHILFEEGQPGERLFFLRKGEVDIMFNIGEEGLSQVDTLYGEEIVGCSALIEPYIYTATGRSRTEIDILEIDAVALRKMMETDCGLGYFLQHQIIRFLMNRILNLRLVAKW